MPTPVDGAPAPNLNQALLDALAAYIGFPHPQHHALMIHGGRGSGKSHLIRHAIDFDTVENGQAAVLVSLSGVRDIVDLDARLYQQLHPALARGPGPLTGAVIRGVPSAPLMAGARPDEPMAAAAIQDPAIARLLKKDMRWVIVLEDLERAAMPPADVLAHVAPFLDDLHCKIVILANEDEIDTLDQRYIARKEKVVGWTLSLAADFDAAIAAFIATLEDPAVRDLCERHKQKIENIFLDSGSRNLTLQREALWTFERFYNVVQDHHRANERAMLELLLLFCALTIELRSARIDRSMLWNNTTSHVALVKEQTRERRVTAAAEVLKRYPSLDFNSGALSMDTMADMILVSALPAEAIRAQLNAHPWFTDPRRLPSWRALWFAFQLPDDQIAEAAARFIADFEGRRFTTEGEILHVAGLWIWLSSIGDRTWRPEAVVTRLRAYIDDVLNAPPSSEDDVFPGGDLIYRMGAAQGLMFRGADDEKFKEIAQYLRQKIAAWRIRGYPRAAGVVWALMETDLEGFRRAVSHSGSGPGRYARLPVLGYFPAEEFVNRFIAMGFQDRQTLLKTLSSRYIDIRSTSELEPEISWLLKVHELMTARLAALPKVAWSYAAGLLDNYLGEIVRDLRRDGHTAG